MGSARGEGDDLWGEESRLELNVSSLQRLNLKWSLALVVERRFAHQSLGDFDEQEVKFVDS